MESFFQNENIFRKIEGVRVFDAAYIEFLIYDNFKRIIIVTGYVKPYSQYRVFKVLEDVSYEYY